MGIGKRIKQAREALSLTQKELADQLGVTASAVTNYENETSHPKEPIMYKMFEALNVDANFLFQDEMQKEKPSAEISERLNDEGMDALIKLYRAAPPELQAAALRVLGLSEKADIAPDGSVDGQ